MLNLLNLSVDVAFGCQMLDQLRRQGQVLVFEPSGDQFTAKHGQTDAASTHAIPPRVSGLNARNAPRLKLKWAFAFPHSSRARSQPALAGGAIIVGNHNGAVYALDRETGCSRWTFHAGAEVRTGFNNGRGVDLCGHALSPFRSC